MSYGFAWHPAALAIFHRLRMHEATAVDRAVIRFAETGEGAVVHDPPYYWLRGGTHYAVLAIDHAERMVTVLRVVRAR